MAVQLENLLNQAIQQNASDIHFEVYQNFFRIRFRVDGVLHLIFRGDAINWPTLNTKLKILANLNIAEKRLPQEGKFTFNYQQQNFDCRVSSCPTIFGEKIALRILNQQTDALTLANLGLPCVDLLKPYLSTSGLILITGPTGSGKSTSLYSILHYLNQENLNIVTVEDPVEINLEGINQVNINLPIGLNFPKILKTFLRQDPDVIMIGEIRDALTAEMAIQAAYTGHLVLSTLHTTSAAHTIMRLLDLKIPAINLTDTLKLVLAQRLLRKLCTVCKAEGDPCPHCFCGYRGRFALNEILPFNQELKELIRGSPDVTAIENFMEQQNIPNLHQLAQQKVKAGLTSALEVKRTLGYQF